MKVTTHRVGVDFRKWKNHTQVSTQSISASIRRIVFAEPTEAYTAEITQSLYYLGRALYRYSLLQKERRKL